MWAAKHCSILFSSVLQQPDRFCRVVYIYIQQLVGSARQQAQWSFAPESQGRRFDSC
jgi:hypothetical protein